MMGYTTRRLYAGEAVKLLRSLNYAERGYLIGIMVVVPADIAGIVAHLMGAI